MLLRKDPMGNPYPIAGFVINPMSTNMVISKDLLGNIIARKMMQDPMNRAMIQRAMQQKAMQEAAANGNNSNAAEGGSTE